MFLEKIRQHLRAAAMVVVCCDVTVMAERPKLKAFKPKMKAFLADALGCEAVNIKAGTNEGCGEIGRGEAIAAHAVVLLGPEQFLQSDRAP